jgi:hypothetical protein
MKRVFWALAGALVAGSPCLRATAQEVCARSSLRPRLEVGATTLPVPAQGRDTLSFAGAMYSGIGVSFGDHQISHRTVGFFYGRVLTDLPRSPSFWGLRVEPWSSSDSTGTLTVGVEAMAVSGRDRAIGPSLNLYTGEAFAMHLRALYRFRREVVVVQVGFETLNLPQWPRQRRAEPPNEETLFVYLADAIAARARWLCHPEGRGQLSGARAMFWNPTERWATVDTLVAALRERGLARLADDVRDVRSDAYKAAERGELRLTDNGDPREERLTVEALVRGIRRVIGVRQR